MVTARLRPQGGKYPRFPYLRRDELRGQMFESESELAYHVVEGIEHRGKIHGHKTQYVNVKTT